MQRFFWPFKEGDFSYDNFYIEQIEHDRPENFNSRIPFLGREDAIQTYK